VFLANKQVLLCFCVGHIHKKLRTLTKARSRLIRSYTRVIHDFGWYLVLRHPMQTILYFNNLTDTMFFSRPIIHS